MQSLFHGTCTIESSQLVFYSNLSWLCSSFLVYFVVPNSSCGSGYYFLKKRYVRCSCAVVIHRWEPGYILVKWVDKWLAPVWAIDCPSALHFGHKSCQEGSVPIPCPLCGVGMQFCSRQWGLAGVCSSRLTASMGVGLLLLVGVGLLLLLIRVVHHDLEEGGAVPPMAGSTCSPAELG